MHRDVDTAARLFVLAAGLLVCPAARANDSVMGGRGANLVPVRSSDVLMRAEAIELVFSPEERAWHIRARYEFENPTAQTLDLQLGFPEYRCESIEEEGGDCVEPSEFRFTDMTTLVRGVAVKQRKGSISPKHEWAPVLGGVWLFNVSFAPHELVPIEHRYVVPSTWTASGGMGVTYVTRTGALWAAPIDRATFTFVIPLTSCLVIEPETIPRRRRRVVLREGKPWIELVFAAQRWVPKADLGLYFETCVAPRDTELEGCSLVDDLARFAYPPETEEDPAPIREAEMLASLAKLDRSELERCGKAVFEAYAAYFKPEELAVLADRPAAKRHYTGPLLTAADWKWVSLVDEALRARQPKSAAKPVPAHRSAKRWGCAVRPRSERSRPTLVAAWLVATTLVFARRHRRPSRPRKHTRPD